MTQFKSAEKRSFWAGLSISLISDFVLAFFIASFFVEDAIPRVTTAAIGLIVWYVFQAGYGIWSAIRAFCLFHVFDKDDRAVALVQKFKAADMPPPDSFYIGPEDYLRQVAASETTPRDALILTGAALGNIEALHSLNHPVLAALQRATLEEAIKRYSASTGGTTKIH